VKKKKRRNVVSSESRRQVLEDTPYRFAWALFSSAARILRGRRATAGWPQGILSHYGTPSIRSNSATKAEMRRCAETALRLHRQHRLRARLHIHRAGRYRRGRRRFSSPSRWPYVNSAHLRAADQWLADLANPCRPQCPSLPEGLHTLQLVMDTGGFYNTIGNFDSFSLQ